MIDQSVFVSHKCVTKLCGSAARKKQTQKTYFFIKIGKYEHINSLVLNILKYFY